MKFPESGTLDTRQAVVNENSITSVVPSKEEEEVIDICIFSQKAMTHFLTKKVRKEERKVSVIAGN